MNSQSLRFFSLALAASCFASGCARGYHAYPNGYIGLGYRPQLAPAFTFYSSYPTPWLRQYAMRTNNGAVVPPGADNSSAR